MAVGYAVSYYASHNGGEVDSDVFVIEKLDTSSITYHNDFYENGGDFGTDKSVTTVVDGTDLVYTVDDSKVAGGYYLTLASYTLVLTDGTVIIGTVDESGNHTFVDLEKSTVVTSSDLKLYLNDFKADGRSKISFTVAGTMTSDSGYPVSDKG